MKKLKTYRFLLTETLAGNYELKAKDKIEALTKISKLILANRIPDGIMNESSGYKIADVKEIKNNS